MELLLHSIAIDWPVLLPIFVCSILVVAVAINRFSYYNRNKRNIGAFIQDLQRALAKNNIAGAERISAQVGGSILKSNHGLKVDVKNPDTIVMVEIRDYAAYIHCGSDDGAGGLLPCRHG